MIDIVPGDVYFREIGKCKLNTCCSEYSNTYTERPAIEHFKHCTHVDQSVT